ncbi:MAG TPA: Gfo/Idh/MocA family oxidoreductase [Gemmatimonadales bacterium]|nr:Gfo/Idh/MocA family oxidoreductase [Gemmatimonadales bacterium]
MTLRVGVIGAGFARRVQIPALRLVPGAEVTAVASGHRANAEAVAREFGIPRVYSDGEELARSPEVDLVIVSSPPDTHARYAIAALEAGKHVLCEKPTALDAGEARAMLDAAARRPDRVAWIDHELRYEPNRRRVRELIREGALGEVRHLELSLKPYLRGDGRPQMTEAPWSWWFDRSRGGGILGAVGSHLIDLCRFWTDAEVVWVGGLAQAFIKRRRDEQGVEHEVTADDFTSFVLRFSTGAVATIVLSTVAHHGPGHLAEITGSAGTLVLTGERTLELGRPGGPLEDISVADDLWERVAPNNMWARSFVRLMRDLVRAIATGRPEGRPATFRDGLAIQRVLDAVRAGGGIALD